MIELTKQICSLHQAKALCELGIKQESVFYWCTHKKESKEVLLYKRHYDYFDSYDSYINPEGDEGHNYVDNDKYSAFTLSELSIMIGRGTKAAEYLWHMFLDLVNSGNSSIIVYNVEKIAKFVIEMLRAGILTKEEINERLTKNESL